VQAVLDLHAQPWNLGRWKATGQAEQWVADHHGDWNDEDWRALLDKLRQSEFWPLDPAAIGAHLEVLRRAWHNLKRWQASGLPQQWVEARQGAWNHADWLALVETLRHSEFWPLNLSEVGATLEECKRAYHNLIRWQLSGHARRWVEWRQGQWNDDAWNSLLTALRQSEYWPLDPAAVARLLEGHQREWWNLKRWRESGLARRWMENHNGQWNHGDWLALLASLRGSGFWPIDPAALAQALDETREEWLNLHRWQTSGEPQRWLAAHPDGGNAAALQDLLDWLWQSEYWPLDVRAVQRVMESLDRLERNLHRWQSSEHLTRWLSAHAAGWNHADWLALLEELRQSDYWPLPPDGVAALLEQRKQRSTGGEFSGAGKSGQGPSVMQMPPPLERRAA
jgi:hypothetical protein